MLGPVSAVIHTHRHLDRQPVTGESTGSTRVQPVMLAMVASLVAATLAVVAHLVVGVGEMPLVVGTLLVASLIGWRNVSPAASTRHRS